MKDQFLQFIWVETAVIVPHGVGKTSPWYCVDIFSYSGPSGKLGHSIIQNIAQAGARRHELLYIPLILTNRLNKTESAVFKFCRFSLFLKDPFVQII